MSLYTASGLHWAPPTEPISGEDVELCAGSESVFGPSAEKVDFDPEAWAHLTASQRFSGMELQPLEARHAPIQSQTPPPGFHCMGLLGDFFGVTGTLLRRLSRKLEFARREGSPRAASKIYIGILTELASAISTEQDERQLAKIRQMAGTVLIDLSRLHHEANADDEVCVIYAGAALPLLKMDMIDDVTTVVYEIPLARCERLALASYDAFHRGNPDHLPVALYALLRCAREIHAENLEREDSGSLLKEFLYYDKIIALLEVSLAVAIERLPHLKFRLESAMIEYLDIVTDILPRVATLLYKDDPENYLDMIWRAALGARRAANLFLIFSEKEKATHVKRTSGNPSDETKTDHEFIRLYLKTVRLWEDVAGLTGGSDSTDAYSKAADAYALAADASKDATYYENAARCSKKAKREDTAQAYLAAAAALYLEDAVARKDISAIKRALDCGSEITDKTRRVDLVIPLIALCQRILDERDGRANPSGWFNDANRERVLQDIIEIITRALKTFRASF